MMSRSFPFAALALIAAAPALLPAQDSTAKEDARMAALSRNEGQLWYAPRSRITVGFRALNSGGRVDFGNLGNVPFVFDVIPASSGAVNRLYNTGQVLVDGARPEEKDSNGNQTSTPGGRYKVYDTVTVPVLDSNGNDTGTTQEIQRLYGDYLAYTPGLTREYTVNVQGQLLEKPGYVAFHNFSAISEGATASKTQGMTGGIELQFSREIGRGTRHLKWGVLAGVTLNDINSKSSGTVTSSLRTYSDYYSTGGVAVPPEQITNPFYSTVVDTDGDGFVNAYETTVPIATTPADGMSTDVITPGGASVTGRWQVKGAYLMFKLGPTIRTQITERLGLSASAGLASAYAGTRYSAHESFKLVNYPGVEVETLDAETGDTTVASSKTKFMTGYYADLTLEWDANESFGLFGGVTAQQLSDYEQKLGDRTARIDLGSAVGLRGGVSIRF
jgi:hypothetical protein